MAAHEEERKQEFVAANVPQRLRLTWSRQRLQIQMQLQQRCPQRRPRLQQPMRRATSLQPKTQSVLAYCVEATCTCADFYDMQRSLAAHQPGDVRKSIIRYAAEIADCCCRETKRKRGSGGGSPLRQNGSAQHDPGPEEAAQLEAVLRRLDAAVTQLHAAMLPNTLLILYTGQVSRFPPRLSA